MGAIKQTKSIFSRNMTDIITAVDGDISCIISIGVNSSRTTNFRLYAVDEGVRLCASDIVDNYRKHYFPHISDSDMIQYALDKISIRVQKETGSTILSTYEIYTIFGGYDNLRISNEYEFIQHNFLTWRPQIAYTSPGVKEQLSFIIHNEGPDSDASYPTTSSRKIFARVYFRTINPIEIELNKANKDKTLYRVDCSYDRIASLIANAGYNEDVIAYDIYGGIDEKRSDSLVINPQRFIVRPRNCSDTHFFFQNTLGGFDTITATGVIVSSAKGDIQTSITRRQETEESNAYVKSWEINTGYIVTAQEENLWHEFLRSTNRYILLENGTYRKIIVEEYKAERATMEADSFTFKFHYAEAAEGSGFNKAESLPEFYIK